VKRIGLCFSGAFRFAGSDKNFRLPPGILRIVFEDTEADLRLPRRTAALLCRARLKLGFLLTR
jgi:hypothetical protein